MCSWKQNLNQWIHTLFNNEIILCNQLQLIEQIDHIYLYNTCEIKLIQAQVDSAMFDKAKIIVMQSVGYINILLMDNTKGK